MGDIRNVLVVGGGIGGLSTTIALGRSGVEVDVVEKNPAWDVYGVGIIQPPNALRALHANRAGRTAAWRWDTRSWAGATTSPTAPSSARTTSRRPCRGWPPMNGLTRPALHKILTWTTSSPLAPTYASA